MYVIGAYLSTFASFILITHFILKSIDDRLEIAIDQSNTIEDREQMLDNRDWRGGVGHLDSREPPRVMQFNIKKKLSS